MIEFVIDPYECSYDYKFALLYSILQVMFLDTYPSPSIGLVSLNDVIILVFGNAVIEFVGGVDSESKVVLKPNGYVIEFAVFSDDCCYMR